MHSDILGGDLSQGAELLCRYAVTRRRLMQGSAAVLLHIMLPFADADQASTLNRTEPTPYDPLLLPVGIRSRFVNVNGLRMHVLEAGFEVKDQPCIVLLHGFPELAYSWRKVMLPIAAAGFHVIAPDRRGYGRTSGSDVRYDDDPGLFATLNQVRDVVALATAFGYRSRSSCDRSRFWLAAGGLVFIGAPGCFPLCGDDERSLCRSPIFAIQHSEWSTV